MVVATVKEFIAWFEGNEKLLEQLAISFKFGRAWQGLSRATQSLSKAPRESETATAMPAARINASPRILFQPENECEAGNSGPDKILLDGNELHEFQEYSGLKMRVDPVE